MTSETELARILAEAETAKYVVLDGAHLFFDLLPEIYRNGYCVGAVEAFEHIKGETGGILALDASMLGQNGEDDWPQDQWPKRSQDLMKTKLAQACAQDRTLIFHVWLDPQELYKPLPEHGSD